MRNWLMSTGFFSLALVSAALVGCGANQQVADDNPAPETAEDQASSMPEPEITLVNSVCPIMGGEAKETVMVDWNGQSVGFCCEDCIPAWEELSDEDRTAMLADSEGEPEAHDGDHPEDDA